MAADTVMAAVHPREILLEEFLKPLGVSQYHVAKQIGLPARRINEIMHGQRRISADTALRLARFLAMGVPVPRPHRASAPDIDFSGPIGGEPSHRAARNEIEIGPEK